MTPAPNPTAPRVPASALEGARPSIGTPLHDARSSSLVASAVQPPPPAKERSQPLTIALGVALIGGLVALMLVISLRLIRRVAEGSPLAAERQRKRAARGAGRDPWREAGRRLVVPPREHADGGDQGQGQGEGESPDDGEPKR